MSFEKKVAGVSPCFMIQSLQCESEPEEHSLLCVNPMASFRLDGWLFFRQTNCLKVYSGATATLSTPFGKSRCPKCPVSYKIFDILYSCFITALAVKRAEMVH